jgi:hypothetical protein
MFAPPRDGNADPPCLLRKCADRVAKQPLMVRATLDSSDILSVIAAVLAVASAGATGYMAYRAARAQRSAKWGNYRRRLYKRLLDVIDQRRVSEDPEQRERLRVIYRSRYNQTRMACRNDVYQQLAKLKPDRPEPVDSAEELTLQTAEVQALADAMHQELLRGRRPWSRR